jgi:hypothetical protein
MGKSSLIKKSNTFSIVRDGQKISTPAVSKWVKASIGDVISGPRRSFALETRVSPFPTTKQALMIPKEMKIDGKYVQTQEKTIVALSTDNSVSGLILPLPPISIFRHYKRLQNASNI